MAKGWVDFEDRKLEAAVEKREQAQETKAEDRAHKADMAFYHYPEGWFASEPS